MKKKKRIRPMGQITADQEILLEEMVDDHELQVAEILYGVWGWLVVHRKGAVEKYLDGGGSPMFYAPEER